MEEDCNDILNSAGTSEFVFFLKLFFFNFVPHPLLLRVYFWFWFQGSLLEVPRGPWGGRAGDQTLVDHLTNCKTNALPTTLAPGFILALSNNLYVIQT